jgi:hypothetical protein
MESAIRIPVVRDLGGRCATLAPPSLPGSSTDLSPRAVLNQPGEPEGCLRPCFTPSSRLRQVWKLTALVAITRPNRVRLRYGSRVRLRQASAQ